MPKTVVLGASPNPSRFSYKCVKSLIRNNYEVVPIGIRKGIIQDVEIMVGKPEIYDVHTVTLYLGSKNQPEYYEYILSLNPKRIIFNPGTYNEELIDLAKKNHIETVIDCTLIMLHSGIY